jgi:hypothetical protein
MWFTAFTFGLWHNMRLGGATRGKCRILDEKGESGLLSCSDIRRWQPLHVSIKDRVGWAIWNKHLLYTRVPQT